MDYDFRSHLRKEYEIPTQHSGKKVWNHVVIHISKKKYDPNLKHADLPTVKIEYLWTLTNCSAEISEKKYDFKKRETVQRILKKIFKRKSNMDCDKIIGCSYSTVSMLV